MNNIGTILLAEDDENDAFLFQRALSKCAIPNPVKLARDGEEALRYLTGVGEYSDRITYPFPCLLVTDLNMPKFSGFDLLARIKRLQICNHLPIVVLSASTAAADRDRSFDLGAREYFVKPADLSGLIDLVQQLKNQWLEPLTALA